MIVDLLEKLRKIVLTNRRTQLLFSILVIFCLSQVYAHALYQSPPLLKATKPNYKPINAFLQQKTSPTDIPTFLSTHGIANIEEYLLWIKENIQYKKDQVDDIWSPPMHTLTKRFGDCEDLAFLNAAVLRHFGYQPLVLAHGNSAKGHVFTVFFKDGSFHVIDNITHTDTKVDSMKKIAYFLIKKNDSKYILSINQNPKAIKVLFLAKGFKLRS